MMRTVFLHLNPNRKEGLMNTGKSVTDTFEKNVGRAIMMLHMEDMLQDYPELLNFGATHFNQCGAIEVSTHSTISFPFLPDLTNIWTPGMVFENGRFGTRDAKLFVFGTKGALLFGKCVAAAAIGEFIRPLEDAIRNRRFRAVGLATHTVWHTYSGEPYSYSERASAIRLPNKGESMCIEVFRFPKRAWRRQPETFLKHLQINAMLRPLFSNEFALGLKTAYQPLVETVGTELLALDAAGHIPETGIMFFDNVRILRVGIHPEVRLFDLKHPKVRACIMETNGKISLQSFTGSWKSLLWLLRYTRTALATAGTRASLRVI